MKTRFLIIFILLAKLSHGQFADRIINYCKGNQFIKLYTLIDSLHETGGRSNINYNAHQEIHRQILGNFYETVLYYEEDKTNFLDYTIQLISDSNAIIYVNIRRIEFVDKPEIAYNYFNKEKFGELQKLYRTTYDTKLSIKDFFTEDVVYGIACGKGASPPEYRLTCEKAIEKKNISLLNKWLTSPTTEKQMYAVEALSRLENKGVALTAKQKNLIELIKNKKGTVRCCAGCRSSTWEIKEAGKLVIKEK